MYIYTSPGLKGLNSRYTLIVVRSLYFSNIDSFRWHSRNENIWRCFFIYEALAKDNFFLFRSQEMVVTVYQIPHFYPVNIENIVRSAEYLLIRNKLHLLFVVWWIANRRWSEIWCSNTIWLGCKSIVRENSDYFTREVQAFFASVTRFFSATIEHC